MRPKTAKLSISAPPDPTKVLWSDFLIFRNSKSEVAVNRAAGDFPEHLHEFVEIVFILSGRGIHKTGAFEHEVSKGDFIMSRPGERHLFFNSSHDFKRLNVQVRHSCFCEAVETLRASGLQTAPFDGRYLESVKLHSSCPLFTPLAFGECLGIALAMEREWLDASDGFGPLLKGKLMELLVVMARAAAGKEELLEDASPRKRLLDAIALLDKDYSRPTLRVAELERVAGLERRSLERAFRAETGLSPKQYLLKTRISWACQLLSHGAWRIQEAAFLCGFRSQSYFTRAFHHALGMTPGEFIAKSHPASKTR